MMAKRSAQLNVVMHDHELAEIHRAARAKSLSTASWARQLLLAEARRINAEEDDGRTPAGGNRHLRG